MKRRTKQQVQFKRTQNQQNAEWLKNATWPILIPFTAKSKKKQSKLKGTINIETGKIITATDLKNKGLLYEEDKSRLQTLKKTVISQTDQNYKLLLLLGYEPRKSKKEKFIPRISKKKHREIKEIWSENLHKFIRVIPVFTKKKKELSPFWKKKMEEWELKTIKK